MGARANEACASHSNRTSDHGTSMLLHLAGLRTKPVRVTPFREQDAVVGMQLAQVGPFRVFFHAELDAVDSDGARVEIKAGNPARFGAKEMFQMLSSRSSTLVYARCRGDMVYRIERKTLGEVAAWTPLERRLSLQDSLLDAMRKLKEDVGQLSDEHPFQLKFAGDGSISVTPRPDVSLLPPRDVVDAIMQPDAAVTPGA